MARIEVAVTSDGGKPLRGALVELRDLVSVTAVTDDAGKVTLTGVGAGWHVVKASADGHASAFREVPTTGDPSAVTTVAITLRAGASVSGTVVDSGGAPVEGARVVPEHVGHFDDFYDARFDAVLTDAKGRWRITGLPRETTRIRAYHAEYAPSASSPIVLGDEIDRGGVTIVLERGVRIRGRVLDAANVPVAGAEVRVSADTILTGQVRRVAADAKGEFAMGGLPRRLMYIMAASEGATSATTPIDLANPPATLELRLDRGASLAGIVVTTAGVPVAEARVTAMRARSDSPTDQLEMRLRGTESAIAGTDGRFEIKGLAPGPYLVRAIRPGSPTELSHTRMGVTVDTGAESKIVVDDLSTVTGKLAFSDGKPATRFAIRMGTAQPRYFTSDTGAFELKDVPAGKTFLNITSPDFVAFTVGDVEVATRPTDLGTLTVAAGRRLEGTVVERNGRAVAGATVILAREIRGDGTSLTPYPDYRVLETVTGADGKFTLRGIGTSMQQVAADHETAGRSAMTTVQPGTANVTLTLALAPTGVIQGFVRVDGKPAEALLIARPVSAADSRISVRTGGDGSYRFDRVAADRYTLIAVILSGHRDELNTGKAYQVDVTPNATVTKDIDLTTAGVTTHLHIGSPSVEFGYGVIAVLDDAAAVTFPLPKTMSEGRTFGGKLAAYAMREGMIVSERTIKFDKVPAGKHIACIAPLRADPADPSVVAEMQRGAADWPLYCKWITIAAAPDPQHVTVDVKPAPQHAP
jgi:protocatechuate 3,4-dioxygenase beta subunit